MNLLSFLLFSHFFAFTFGVFQQFTNYCCHYSNSVSCELGGCAVPSSGSAHLTTFFPVADCKECQTTPFDNSTTSGLITSCTFCEDDGDNCTFPITNTGCDVQNKKLELYGFEMKKQAPSTNHTKFSYIADQDFCCYWKKLTPGSNKTRFEVASAVGGCPKAAGGIIHTTELLSFKEKSSPTDCPKVPPCAFGCSGHGVCVGNQCVCESSYFGELCSIKCDSSNCKMGVCGPPSLADMQFEAFFDASVVDEWQVVSASTASACKCFLHVNGTQCEACEAGYAGHNCADVCPGAPCNKPNMNGSCSFGQCDCVRGYAGGNCDTCAPGFSGPNCSCNAQECHAPFQGFCNINGTCSCHNQWGGNDCNDCQCLHGFNCTLQGICACESPFTGDKCEQCEPPFYNVAKKCSVRCDVNQCQHSGACNATTGLCDCPEHALGANCTTCEDNYFGFDCGVFCDANVTCSGLGSCNNITGLCDCPTGFSGDCTVCGTGFYPKGKCDTFCDSKHTCNGNGQCDDQGDCKCSNDVIYNKGDCAVKLWVIIVPCILLVAAFGAFFGCIVWYKRKNSYDDWGEPLLY